MEEQPEKEELFDSALSKLKAGHLICHTHALTPRSFRIYPLKGTKHLNNVSGSFRTFLFDFLSTQLKDDQYIYDLDLKACHLSILCAIFPDHTQDIKKLLDNGI